MKTIKVKAPAKINLTLEVLNKREDGFHNIKSVMQAISLYDFLTFSISENDGIDIVLTGNSANIPYDSKNLVYKASQKFFEETGITNKKLEVFIEKNIPVEAGLAGGSTDASAAFFALNELFSHPLSDEKIQELCASLGSDLNFCLTGGTAVCTGRGENIQKVKTSKCPVTLIKPTGFGISAKEAYTKFSQLSPEKKEVKNNTEKMAQNFDKALICNSLETAVIDDYEELKEIKKHIPDALMSGSGPTFFVLQEKSPIKFDQNRFLVIENLEFIEDGVKKV